jgi:hypothetical protein
MGSSHASGALGHASGAAAEHLHVRTAHGPLRGAQALRMRCAVQEAEIGTRLRTMRAVGTAAMRIGVRSAWPLMHRPMGLRQASHNCVAGLCDQCEAGQGPPYGTASACSAL